MEEYARKHPSRAVSAFAEFTSMSGKQKMIEAYNVGKCRRCCNYSKYKHKYINGVWPEVKEAPEPSVIIWEN